jgi:hypothetical protein
MAAFQPLLRLTGVTCPVVTLTRRERPARIHRVALADLIVLLILAGAFYLALYPVRRRIERAYLRRRAGGRRRAPVVPLIRRPDGVFARKEKENGYGHKR